MKEEKIGDPWPDKPADENISTDPPNRFDRDETDYNPGMTPPRERQSESDGNGESSRERGVPRRG